MTYVACPDCGCNVIDVRAKTTITLTYEGDRVVNLIAPDEIGGFLIADTDRAQCLNCGYSQYFARFQLESDSEQV